jgi:flagellar basal body P-ring formation protein FlgA
MKARKFLWVFLLTMSSGQVYGQKITDLDQLLVTARNYLLEKIQKKLPKKDHTHLKISSYPIDSRLKLHQCDKPLTLKHQDSARIKGSVSVKITCHSPHAWSIYTKHKVALEKGVLVTKYPLAKHHVISDKDLTTIKLDVYSQRSGYITNTSQIIGKQLTRNLSEGKIINAAYLSQPQMIKKGDVVNIIAKIGSLSVVTSGIAKSDGRIGDQIDVANKRSSRIIRAEIVGTNAVEVIL